MSVTDPRVESVVEAVSACIEAKYVDAAAGARAAEHLRRLARAGRYVGASYGAELAAKLMTDLHAELPDLHLQVRWSDQAQEASTTSQWDDPGFMADYWRREDLANQGFEKAERLAGNVGSALVCE